MILANEQVAGYLADRRLPTLYRVHERPDPQSVDVPGRAAGEPRRPDAAAAQAHDAAAGGRRGRPRSSRIVARECATGRGARLGVARAALAEAGLLLAAQPRPRRARRARATATSRRRSGATRTSSPTAALLQGLGIDEAATPAHELEEAGVASSSAEREAMQIERDADDICLAFLLERALAEADGDEPPSFEGEVVGPDREGRLRPLRRGGLRGLPAGAAAARLVEPERAGHGARGARARGARLRLGDSDRGRGRPGRRAARAGRPRPPMHTQ